MPKPAATGANFDVILAGLHELDDKLAQIQYELDALKEPAPPRYLTEPILNSLDDIPDMRGGEFTMATKTLNIPVEEIYPEWKRQAKKALRVFVAAFVGTIVFDVATNCNLELIDSCAQYYWDWAITQRLVMAAVTAAVAALGNWWRIDKPYTSLAHQSIV